jgi:hypothetical protein
VAKQTGTIAVHATLTGTTVDVVTLAQVSAGSGVASPGITVVNRTGTDAIFFTVSATATAPAEPTVGGKNTFVVPAAITSVRVPVSPGSMGRPVVVKLVSAGAEAYSVEAL